MKLTTTAIYFSGCLSMKYKIDDTLINFLAPELRAKWLLEKTRI